MFKEMFKIKYKKYIIAVISRIIKLSVTLSGFKNMYRDEYTNKDIKPPYRIKKIFSNSRKKISMKEDKHQKVCIKRQ